MNNRHFQTAYILPILFGLIIVLMLVLYIFLPQQDFSQKENRTLQTRPSVTFSGLADGSFMDRFETYTTEQLPFREFFVDVKAALNRLTLSRENNGVILGEDGYLFEKSYGIGAQLSKNEAAILAFLGSADRAVTVAIAPNASEILKDKLPKGCMRIDQSRELGDLYEKIGALPNGNYVNLIETLQTHTQEQLYYRTDHHWTTEAAYLGYLEIVNALSDIQDAQTENAEEQRILREVQEKSLPAPVKLEELQKQEVRDFYGTLYAKYKDNGLPGDTLTYYDIPVTSFTRSDGSFDSLYDLEKLKIYDKYAMFLRGNDEICTIHAENAKNGRTLVVFKDSYANCLLPFLTYQYDEIVVVDLRYYADSVSELLKEHEDADILLLYNFSFLNEDNHFYRLTS